MEILQQNLNEIANVFEYKYDELFFYYLKLISKQNIYFCNKTIKKGEGGWKCLDCIIDSNSLMCNNCYNKSKEKHKGHRIKFYPEQHGFCDCGNHNFIIQESFCPDHQGAFTNKEEMINFIIKKLKNI